MKVILEIEYNSMDFSFVVIFKLLKSMGLTTRIFKIGDLSDFNLDQNKPTLITIGFVKGVVSKITGMNDELLKGNQRALEIAENRQIAMYLCRKYTRRSLREIGAEFGHKTPATVLHACKTVLNLVQTDKKFLEKLHLLEEHFKGL